MMAGELKQEVPVRSNDELGALNRAFNRLSADLAPSNALRRQMTADESGLGLVIAKSITEAHGGKIEVQSDLGRGTTLTLVLPPA
jgi:signal transduction histidine kinase